MAFSFSKDFRWNGIKSSTFFERPEATVVVEFDGVDNVDIANNKFPLTADVDSSMAYSVVADKISARYPGEQLLTMKVTNDNNFYSVIAEYPDMLNNVDPDPERMEQKLGSKESAFADKALHLLNLSKIVDKEFLSEMQLFIDVVNALLLNEKRVHLFKANDLIWMQSLALKNVKETYGLNSPQMTEALEIAKYIIKKIDSGLKELYGDNYLMLALAVDFHNEVPKTRMGRSLLVADTATVNGSSINLSPSYDEDYPAMFNIIFFISLLLSLTVFAIALGMWFIDPGRDSIIYRMTSQRMKKDQ